MSEDVTRTSKTRCARGLWAIAMLVMAPVALSSCTDVSPFHADWLPFTSNHMVSVSPSGVAPQSGSCSGGFDDTYAMQLVLLDTDHKALKAGDEVGSTFAGDEDDYEYDVYEATDQPPPVPFEAEAGIEAGSLYSLPDVTCGSDADCPSGYACGGARESSRCGVFTDLNSGQIEYSEDNEPESQALVVAMAHTGAWRGWGPMEMDGHYPYSSDAATPVDSGQPLDVTPSSARAVDFEYRRTNALTMLADAWDNLQGHVDEEDREAYFGLWTFAENPPGQTTSQVADVRDDQAFWTDRGDEAIRAVDELRHDADNHRANVYASLLDVLDDAFDDPAVAGELDAARVVVVVPGHDEVRENTADDVIERINDLSNQTGTDISMTIVQVDGARDVSEIPDDWAYYTESGANQAPCTGDQDCHNFETCREPTWYTSDPDADSEADVAYPRADERGETFCMPDYDENGRLGPIEDYHRIGCETGGAYYYVPQISQQLLEEYFIAQVWEMEASWQFDFQFQQDVESSGVSSAVLLETELQVVGPRATEVYSFQREREDRDRRRVLFGGP